MPDLRVVHSRCSHPRAGAQVQVRCGHRCEGRRRHVSLGQRRTQVSVTPQRYCFARVRVCVRVCVPACLRASEHARVRVSAVFKRSTQRAQAHRGMVNVGLCIVNGSLLNQVYT